MNSTPAEFQRALRLVFGDGVSEASGGLLLVEGGVRLHFALQSEKALKIGALQLASLRVEISVLEGDEAAAAKQLARVDRATQRGGG
jgi:hypothetical protein